MKIVYHAQKPAKNFVILDRINMVYNSSQGIPTVQIYPFKVKIGDSEYSFPGINNGSWYPNTGDTILAELDGQGNFCLTAISSDLKEQGISEENKPIGIIAHFGEDKITIVNHKDVM